VSNNQKKKKTTGGGELQPSTEGDKIAGSSDAKGNDLVGRKRKTDVPS